MVIKLVTIELSNNFTHKLKRKKMKRIALLTLGIMATSLTFAQQKTEAAKISAPVVAEVAKPAKDIMKYFEFTNADWNFGKIPQGKPVEFDLFIKNISKDSAVLDNVQVSCGCTTPKYTKGQKFGPGEKIKVTLGFNAGVMGAFSKTVTIFLNNNEFTKQVSFHGETFTVPSAPAPANSATEKLKPAGE